MKLTEDMIETTSGSHLPKKLRYNETGKLSGQLTVCGYSHTHNGKTYWKCQCACGNSCIIAGKSMRQGRTRSCGCFQKEVTRRRFTKHGHGGPGKNRSRAYEAWANMKARCNNSLKPGYAYYGGRGIKVCDAWDKSFAVFHKDMGDIPEAMSLDRIDVNGNYEPGNCKWSTKKEQVDNRRPLRRIEDFSDAQLHAELKRRTLTKGTQS